MSATKADRCEYCGSALATRKRLVTVYRHTKHRHFIFKDVPARVCSLCGERYFSATVVGQMQRQMRKRATPAQTVPVPVISLRPAG